MDAINSQRARSPSFPVHTLAECIDRCRTIFQRIGRNHVVPAQVAAALELSDKSSHFFQLLGALKQFGLLEPLGPARLSLSPAALDLVLLSKDSPQHRLARRACAKTPAVFAVIQRFFPSGASDETLVHFLLTQHKFTRDSAIKCVQIFRSTQADAGDNVNDAVSAPPQPTVAPAANSAADPGSASHDIPAGSAIVLRPTTGNAGAHDAGENPARDFVVHLTRGRQVVLRVPTDLSAADFQLLRRQMELHLDVIEQTMIDAPASPAAGGAGRSFD
jgi:hypothetical protein